MSDEKCKSLGGSVTPDFGTAYCQLDDGMGNTFGIEDISCSLRPYPNKIDATQEDLPKIAQAMGERSMSSFALCEDAFPKQGRVTLGVPPDVLKTSPLFRSLAEHCEALDPETCAQIGKMAEENPKIESESFWSVKSLLKVGIEGLIMGAGFVLAGKWFGGGHGPNGGGGGGGGGTPQTHQIGVEVPLAAATVVAVETAPSLLTTIGEGLWWFGEGTVNAVGAAASFLIVVPESELLAPPDVYDNGPI